MRQRTGAAVAKGSRVLRAPRMPVLRKVACRAAPCTPDNRFPQVKCGRMRSGALPPERRQGQTSVPHPARRSCRPSAGHAGRPSAGLLRRRATRAHGHGPARRRPCVRGVCRANGRGRPPRPPRSPRSPQGRTPQMPGAGRAPKKGGPWRVVFLGRPWWCSCWPLRLWEPSPSRTGKASTPTTRWQRRPSMRLPMWRARRLPT